MEPFLRMELYFEYCVELNSSNSEISFSMLIISRGKDPFNFFINFHLSRINGNKNIIFVRAQTKSSIEQRQNIFTLREFTYLFFLSNLTFRTKGVVMVKVMILFSSSRKKLIKLLPKEPAVIQKLSAIRTMEVQ
jgi:hypothetical protein